MLLLNIRPCKRGKRIICFVFVCDLLILFRRVLRNSVDMHDKTSQDHDVFHITFSVLTLDDQLVYKSSPDLRILVNTFSYFPIWF